MQKIDYFRSSAMMSAMKHFCCARCGIDDGTICGAHRDSQDAGKGRGIKSHDLVAALCHKCNQLMTVDKSLTKNERDWMWDRAFYETMRIGFSREIFVVAK
jgi:hypothetical protein